MSSGDSRGVIVRPASLDDARGIAEVHVQAWREAYVHQLPATVLADLGVEPRVERWAAIIADDVTDVHVVELDGRIVGWATASEGRDDDRPVRRELEGIYVLAERHGTGAGQLLLDAVVGADDAYLWMMDDNPRAEAFYRRNGFVRDGAERDHTLAGHPIHIVRLVRHDAVTGWAAVKDAELTLLDAEVRRDAARVSGLLHPAFVEIGRSGNVRNESPFVAVGHLRRDPTTAISPGHGRVRRRWQRRPVGVFRLFGPPAPAQRPESTHAPVVERGAQRRVEMPRAAVRAYPATTLRRAHSERSRPITTMSS